MKSDNHLIEKIGKVLKKEFPHDTVDVSPSGVRDNIHVVVMSRKFDDMTEKQKEEYLWDLIDQSGLTPKEKLRISLIVPLSPADVK